MRAILNHQELANVVRRNYLLSQLTTGVRVMAVLVLVGGLTYHAGTSYYEQQQGLALDAFVQAQAQQTVAQAGLDIEY